MQSFIPLSVPNLKGNELKYVTDAVQTEWVSTAGAYVKRFEEDFSAYARTQNAAAVQSGTAALHLALLLCNAGTGDLVIAPTLTFIAAINPIRYVNADPVFMDCDDSLCMDPEKLSRYLERECELRNGVCYDKAQNKAVKAIVVVHVFGNGADMEAITELARRCNLRVVEDATEAVGTFYTAGRFDGKMAGTIGDFGAYSFNGNKIITTGGGGMFTARNDADTVRARHLSTQAKTDDVYYTHDEIGYNYRMTNVQAALGTAQLEQLESFVATKRANYEKYIELGLPLLPFSGNARPNYWFYSFMSKNRDGLIQHLASQRIQARPVWALCNAQHMYKNCRAYEIEKASAYYNKIVNLPCGSSLTFEDVERVAAAVKEFEE